MWCIPRNPFLDNCFFWLLFLLLLTETTSRKTLLLYFPPSSASYYCIFCQISILKSLPPASFLFFLIKSKGKRIGLPPKAFFFFFFLACHYFYFKVSQWPINLSHQLYIFAITLPFITCAAAILPPFHLWSCFNWTLLSSKLLVLWPHIWAVMWLIFLKHMIGTGN